MAVVQIAPCLSDGWPSLYVLDDAGRVWLGGFLKDAPGWRWRPVPEQADAAGGAA